MTKFLNLTPHDVHIYSEQGALIETVSKSEFALRCSATNPPLKFSSITVNSNTIPIYTATVFDGIVISGVRSVNIFNI